MTEFLEKHSKSATIISVIIAALGILLVIFIFTSSSRDVESKPEDNRIGIDFFIPETVTLSGESIDNAFNSANESTLSPEFFWDNMGVLCGDKLLSYSEGNLIIKSVNDPYFVRQYNIEILGAPTAVSVDGILNIVYCDKTTSRLMITDLKSEPRFIGDIVCAYGENLSSVFSDGRLIYYVDDAERTVCSVLPDGTEISNVSVVRVSSYFVNNKTLYYSNGTMLNSKRTYGGESQWLYECSDEITDISATDENVYMGWNVNTTDRCCARFNLSSGKYTPLGGNPKENPKLETDSEVVSSNLKNDEIPENMPELQY